MGQTRSALHCPPAARTLENHDLTGALRLGGMAAPMLLDGPMDREMFQAYIE